MNKKYKKTKNKNKKNWWKLNQEKEKVIISPFFLCNVSMITHQKRNGIFTAGSWKLPEIVELAYNYPRNDLLNLWMRGCYSKKSQQLIIWRSLWSHYGPAYLGKPQPSSASQLAPHLQPCKHSSWNSSITQYRVPISIIHWSSYRQSASQLISDEKAMPWLSNLPALRSRQQHND